MMNIFLNDRCISLLSKKPKSQARTGMTVAFTSKQQLSSLFSLFEQDETIEELAIWSESEYEKLCRKFFSLFIRIDAAGGFVVNEQGHFLFIYRFNHWDLPKGKIDKQDDHSSQRAAIREVKEETGLRSVRITGDLPSSWHIYPHKKGTILKRTFWYEMFADSEQGLMPQEDEGIGLVKWVPPEEIHEILSQTYASLREIIRSGIRLSPSNT